jgi:hypothetical protein
MWAANAAKLGYKWNLGNGMQVKFWEDTWFGSSPLAVQFWDLYNICNEQLAVVAQVWDGTNLKLTFRRIFSDKLMEQWYELEQICTGISFSSDCDSLIWTYTASGTYTSSSLYKIITHRGIIPLFIPSIWSLTVPPRIHIFLWLLSNNKLMTRDNLEKRNMGKPTQCEFCGEPESITHLFFDCIVAREIWTSVSMFLKVQIGTTYESIARFWPANKNHSAMNTICAAVLWGIWKNRNAMIFDGQTWLCIKQVWWLILKAVKKWRLIFRPEMQTRVDQFSHHDSTLLRTPGALPWS